jgi:hypothetical protein
MYYSHPKNKWHFVGNKPDISAYLEVEQKISLMPKHTQCISEVTKLPILLTYISLAW